MSRAAARRSRWRHPPNSTARIARTWQVLTDYGRLAEFVPDMQVEPRGFPRRQQAVVEQKGEARVLFLSFPIDVRLAVTEYPYERVSSRAVAGNFREMRSTYSLEAGQGRILLRYSGHMVPDFYVPPLIGTLALAAQRRGDLSRARRVRSSGARARGGARTRNELRAPRRPEGR